MARRAETIRELKSQLQNVVSLIDKLEKEAEHGEEAETRKKISTLIDYQQPQPERKSRYQASTNLDDLMFLSSLHEPSTSTNIQTSQQSNNTERNNSVPAVQSAEIGEFPYRVIHLDDNPFELEVKKLQVQFQELQRENERLRARLELLESGNDADVTRRIDDAVNSQHQTERLLKQVEELKVREGKILDSFRKTSREYREVCYLLTGYRIDALKDRVYRLSHMYADSEDEKLFFEIAPDGEIQLLKNDYSDRLSTNVTTYLEQADSFPAFLASITLDLLKSTTQVEPMSMCVSMSTTVRPNPHSVLFKNRY